MCHNAGIMGYQTTMLLWYHAVFSRHDVRQACICPFPFSPQPSLDSPRQRTGSVVEALLQPSRDQAICMSVVLAAKMCGLDHMALGLVCFNRHMSNACRTLRLQMGVKAPIAPVKLAAV